MNTFDNVILNSEGYKNIIVNNKGVIIYILAKVIKIKN
ncbi:hypothetical protein A1YO_03297 [Escherichia coli KTE136]|jgi:hypothetical protein|uniref:Uncharacterized protein n=1 Tax=Escherichia coli DORA_A_5_14_21 TaxID=1403943 RepID=W1VYU0_ECOLX|nr:hypothetical protein A1Y1_03141 [Escherichia coli KTE115]ELG68103.1 hypothetical protein A1YO_03297 [Escherichia coli KTE136]ETJ11213.1 MAG: hypothetical protein Q609_ECAC02881G0003 [Escherichia coli DORA_A_5_14_21]GCX15052.1 hypothetical protein HmCmsJML082_03448 [Escherichia coli]SYX10415.1 Uncharacterised protein [Escherichia coli]